MDATVQLLINWATSVASSVIATAVAALFRVAVIFARWAECAHTGRSLQYDLVWPYSWQFAHCTGLLRSCGSLTAILRCSRN